MSKKQSIALSFLRFAGRFYKWAFRSIFGLVRKSDEDIKAIEQKKRARIRSSDPVILSRQSPT
jgi:hypothetical protein